MVEKIATVTATIGSQFGVGLRRTALQYRNLVRVPLIWLRSLVFSMRYPGKSRFTCPICGYVGPFLEGGVDQFSRVNARCPSCGSLERHRLQALVLERFSKNVSTRQLVCLQFAPDQMTPVLKSLFGKVVTADIEPGRADLTLDMTSIELPDSSFDVVYASHVLEHIVNDILAMKEIHRVLKPGGIAIMPVPILATDTVEYPHPVPTEEYHVRAPGIDYYTRFSDLFQTTRFASADFPQEYQTYVYEDRQRFPNAAAPYRPGMVGDRHEDMVPVYVKGGGNGELSAWATKEPRLAA